MLNTVSLSIFIEKIFEYFSSAELHNWSFTVFHWKGEAWKIIVEVLATLCDELWNAIFLKCGGGRVRVKHSSPIGIDCWCRSRFWGHWEAQTLFVFSPSIDRWGAITSGFERFVKHRWWWLAYHLPPFQSTFIWLITYILLIVSWIVFGGSCSWTRPRRTRTSSISLRQPIPACPRYTVGYGRGYGIWQDTIGDTVGVTVGGTLAVSSAWLAPPIPV